jgi:hypothetical protein
MNLCYRSFGLPTRYSPVHAHEREPVIYPNGTFIRETPAYRSEKQDLSQLYAFTLLLQFCLDTLCFAQPTNFGDRYSFQYAPAASKHSV